MNSLLSVSAYLSISSCLFLSIWLSLLACLSLWICLSLSVFCVSLSVNFCLYIFVFMVVFELVIKSNLSVGLIPACFFHLVHLSLFFCLFLSLSIGLLKCPFSVFLSTFACLTHQKSLFLSLSVYFCLCLYVSVFFYSCLCVFSISVLIYFLSPLFASVYDSVNLSNSVHLCQSVGMIILFYLSMSAFCLSMYRWLSMSLWLSSSIPSCMIGSIISGQKGGTRKKESMRNIPFKVKDE